jgi:hypothetical protein
MSMAHSHRSWVSFISHVSAIGNSATSMPSKSGPSVIFVLALIVIAPRWKYTRFLTVLSSPLYRAYVFAVES